MADEIEGIDFIEVPDTLFPSPERVWREAFREAYNAAGIGNAHQLKLAVNEQGDKCSYESAQTAFERPQRMTQRLTAKVLKTLGARGIDTTALMDRACCLGGLHEAVGEYEQVRMRVSALLDSFLALEASQQDMLIYQVRGAVAGAKHVDDTSPHANACRNMRLKLDSFLNSDDCRRML